MEFKVKNRKYLQQVEIENGIFEGDKLYFSYDLVVAICRSTGLRSKKKRHLTKRFKLIINQAITDLMEKYETDRSKTQAI